MTITKVYISRGNSPDVRMNRNIFFLHDGKISSYLHGQSHVEDVKALGDSAFVREQIHSYTDPTGNKFVDFQVAPQHMIFLNDKGEIFGVGKNRSGVLTGSKVEMFAAPKKMDVPNNEKVLKIAVANTNTHILTDKGHIYSLGTNKWEQLGMKATSERVKWVQATNSEEVKFTDLIVEPGRTEDYRVYSRTDKGEIGVFSSEGVSLFSEAEVKKSFNPGGKKEELLPLKDTKLFVTQDDTTYIVDNDIIYEAAFYNGVSGKRIDIVPQMKLPEVIDISKNFIATKDGKIVISQKKTSPSIDGFSRYPVEMQIDPTLNSKGVDHFSAMYEMIRKEPKTLLSVSRAQGILDEVILGVNGNAYVFKGASSNALKQHSYNFNESRTLGAAVATNSFMDYDPSFIGGIILSKSNC